MKAPTHPSFSSNERDLFLVLDGGGARGIAHVAVWRALERLVARPREDWKPSALDTYGPERYRLAGVAGTSAGAIAAAFIAAGADAGDLIDGEGRVPLCTVLGLEHFHAIFGIRGWRRVKFFRFFLGGPSKNEARIASLTREMENSGYSGLPSAPPPARKARRVSASTEEALGDKPGAIVDDNRETSGDRDFHRVTRRIAFIFFLTIAATALSFIFPAIPAHILRPDVPLPVYLIILWFALHVCFITVGQITRSIEATKAKRNERHYSDLLAGMVHPCASTVYAFLLASLTCFVVQRAYQWSDWQGVDPNVVMVRFPRTWRLPWPPPSPVTQGDAGLVAAWLACVGFYYFSLRRTLREFFKGSIAPERIQDDIERVLRYLLVHRCNSWDNDLKRHVWTEREKVTEFRRALASRRTDKEITFKELFNATEIHLTIVAADAVRNEVHTYSAVTHPDESVAKAVSASMAIPFLFRPVRDSLRLLVDGAIVSSIPAWVFRRHRNRDPDCLILAARIEPESYDYWIPLLRDYRDEFAKQHRIGKARFWWRHSELSWRWPWALFMNIISTGAFGARALELDASDRLESFSLWPDIGLLDFDIASEDLAPQLVELEHKSELEIVNLLWERKRSFQAICKKIEDVIRGKIDDQAASKDIGYIRMFWATRDGNADSVRMKLTYNFKPECHVDDRLVMPYGTSMSALAMQTPGSQFANVSVLSKLQADRMNRYRAAVKWKRLAWCWAIPVRDPKSKRVVGILGIESDTHLTYFDEAVGKEANRRSGVWLKLNSQELAETPQELLAAAKANSEVRGRMFLWEDQFAGMIWRHFVDPSV